jgi:hypothetical protein
VLVAVLVDDPGLNFEAQLLQLEVNDRPGDR